MQNTIMTGGALQFKPCKQMLLSKYRQVCGTENVTNDETTNVKARKYDNILPLASLVQRWMMRKDHSDIVN